MNGFSCSERGWVESGGPWGRPPAWMVGVAVPDVLRIDCMFRDAAVAAQHRSVSHTTAPGGCQSFTAQAVPAVPSLGPALMD